MATISAATAPTSSVNRPSLVRIQRSARVSSSSVLGLPVAVKKGRVRCSIEEKASSPLAKAGMGAWLISTAAAAAWSPAAMALVDERLSTEGTGLSFGLSNNLLGWILLGIFGLIWTLYFGYTSTLEEDEESGLSL